jgi:hypothetical protein
MTGDLTVAFRVSFRSGARGKRIIQVGPPPAEPDVPAGRVPRLARLLALAIRVEDLVRAGEISDYAEASRLGHVSRSRMTQIMNLVNLAPDIQEEILFLPNTVTGRDVVGERDVRPVAAQADWARQRALWRALLAG